MSAQGLFTFAPPPDFWDDGARITVPGAAEPAPISVQWRVLGRKAVRAWIEAFEKRPQAESLAEVIADWRVDDADGQPVPFSRVNLEEFLDLFQPAGGELARRYVEVLAESRLGN